MLKIEGLLLLEPTFRKKFIHNHLEFGYKSYLAIPEVFILVFVKTKKPSSFKQILQLKL